MSSLTLYLVIVHWVLGSQPSYRTLNRLFVHCMLIQPDHGCISTFHPFTPDEWSQQTPTQMRTYLIQNLPDPHGPAPVPSGPISSSRPTGYSTAAIELMGFKKGIKREIAAYPSLKDERYFDGFVSQMQ